MKKGISLIVLVITIIVMIIIAGAIIISLNSTNILTKANTAVDASNESELKAAASLEFMNQYVTYWEAKEKGETATYPTAATLLGEGANRTELGKMLDNMNNNTTGKVYAVTVDANGVKVTVTDAQ